MTSLEDTNAARLRNCSARSVGLRDSGANNAPVRSAKERIRERRRREQEGNSSSRRQRLSPKGILDESDDNDPSENWLFEEVTGESLGGRSNRSKNSGGGQSRESQRSHWSQHSSRRRQTRRLLARFKEFSQQPKLAELSKLQIFSSQVDSLLPFTNVGTESICCK